MRVFQGAATIFGLMVAGFGVAWADPMEPAHGTQLRQDLLNTVRAVAEYELGAPVEFVVIELQADDDLAFARLFPQRPGGDSIDLDTTPLVTLRHTSPEAFDGSRMEVFLQRTQGAWSVTEYAVGSTDAWWFGYRCDVYGAFLQNMGC